MPELFRDSLYTLILGFEIFFITHIKMPLSKFSEKPAFNENHGFLKCTCGQFLEFKSKKEEKLKIRLHFKYCSNPLEGFETIKPPRKRFSNTEAEHSWNEYLKKFHQ